MEITTTATTTPGVSRAYVINKLFSLFGVIPLSVYTVWHLYGNLTALQGPEAFNQYYDTVRARPFWNVLMLTVIWAPLVFHAIYGLIKIKQARPNNTRFNYWDNLRYLTQRVSGIGVLLFIPAHLVKSKILPTYIDGVPANFQHMAEGLAQPLSFGVYMLGILGVAYHLANGLWQASIGWGLTTTQKAMNRMQVFCSIFFIVILSMGYAALLTLAKAGGLF